MADVVEDETVRASRLLDAQDKAEQLFAEIEQRGLTGEQLYAQVAELSAAAGWEVRARGIGDFVEELLDLAPAPSPA